MRKACISILAIVMFVLAPLTPDLRSGLTLERSGGDAATELR